MELKDHLLKYLRFLDQQIKRRKKRIIMTDRFWLMSISKGYNETLMSDVVLDDLYIKADEVAKIIIKKEYNRV